MIDFLFYTTFCVIKHMGGALGTNILQLCCASICKKLILFLRQALRLKFIGSLISKRRRSKETQMIFVLGFISLCGIAVGIVMSLLQLGHIYIWSVLFAQYVCVFLYLFRRYRHYKLEYRRLQLKAKGSVSS